MPTLPIYTHTSQKKPQRCPQLQTLATHPYDVYTLTDRLPILLSGLLSPPTQYLSLPTPALLTADALYIPYSQHSARSRITRSRYGHNLSYLIVCSLALAKIPSNLQSYMSTVSVCSSVLFVQVFSKILDFAYCIIDVAICI